MKNMIDSKSQYCKAVISPQIIQYIQCIQIKIGTLLIVLNELILNFL